MNFLALLRYVLFTVLVSRASATISLQLPQGDYLFTPQPNFKVSFNRVDGLGIATLTQPQTQQNTQKTSRRIPQKPLSAHDGAVLLDRIQSLDASHWHAQMHDPLTRSNYPVLLSLQQQHLRIQRQSRVWVYPSITLAQPSPSSKKVNHS